MSPSRRSRVSVWWWSMAERPVVLLSAYACRPDHGSEQAVGWEWLTAAAVHARVFLLTRERNAEAIAHSLPATLAANIEICSVDLGSGARWLKRRVPLGTHIYYLLWQLQAYREAKRLMSHQAFDVIHHVTFATDWQFAGVMMLRSRALKIWGPIGGASTTPWSLLRYLGVRGVISDLIRWACSGMLRKCLAGPQASRADVILVQNQDVANWLAKRGCGSVVRPNAAVSEGGEVSAVQEQSQRLIFAGRLIPWKGAALAIDVLTQLDQRWTLDLYGEGPDLARLRRRVATRGLERRVRFHGRVARQDLHREFTSARALLFPSLHDSGPWVVAEAAALGLKTVCLDLGGTALLAESTGGKVISHREPDVVKALAEAIETLDGQTRPGVWSRTALEGYLRRLYGPGTSDGLVSPLREAGEA